MTEVSSKTFLLFAIVIFLLMLIANCSSRAETVVASSYGDPKDIRRTGERLTATGKHLDPNGNFIAHRTLPIGTTVRLVHYHRVLDVVVDDRGPFIKGRTFDLNPRVNTFLQCGGLCKVKVEPWPPLPRAKPEIPEPMFAWGQEGGP